MKLAAMLTTLLLSLCAARADVSLSLSPSVQQSAAGLELVFSGTITNNSATDQVFLNDISFTTIGDSATFLTPELNHFFANVPGILLPNESYSGGEIFRVLLSASAPAEDYGGSITVIGGADIFATSNLANTAFTILSPAVSITATTPDASELGPVSGVFTLARTGSTTLDLPVSFAVSGTAVNGTTYSAIASPVIIPSGSSSTTVTILPIPDDIAEGDRTVILKLCSSTLYNSGSPMTDLVTVHDKPADNWRFLNFGALANTPAAADNADFDGDGIPNLMEYALNLNPKVADRTALPQPVLVGGYLTLTYVPNAIATDLTFTVESSTDLINWGSADVEPTTLANPPPNSLSFRYKYPVTQSSGAFLRLKVTR
jgi:hypothetical protein